MYLTLDHHDRLRAQQLFPNIKLYAMVVSEVCMVVCMLTVAIIIIYLSCIDAELNTKSNIEDMEAFVAEVRELMAKIERLNERLIQFRAEQQAQAAAERAAKKRESLKNEDVSVTTCMFEVEGWGVGGGPDNKNGCTIKLMCKLLLQISSPSDI